MTVKIKITSKYPIVIFAILVFIIAMIFSGIKSSFFSNEKENHKSYTMTRLDIGDDSTFYSHAPDYNRVGQKTSPHIVIRKNTLTICSLDTGKTWHNHDTFDHEHLNLPKYRSDSDILERPNMIFSITNTDSGKVFKPAQLKKS